MKRTFTTLGLAALTVGMLSTGAVAQSSTTTFTGQLDGVNSDATGNVTIELDRATNEADITIDADGLLPGFPHAQHIHGDVGTSNVCPSLDEDTDGDGFVSTPEGQATYGPILTSLTTEGDTTPESALAVERFPTYDDGTYTRTIELPGDVASELANLHIVVHGIDINDNGEYDFDGNGESELDPELPFEASAPAMCGTLAASASGGVQTGAGGTADTGSSTPLGLVALGALTVGGLAYGVTKRRSVES